MREKKKIIWIAVMAASFFAMFCLEAGAVREPFGKKTEGSSRISGQASFGGTDRGILLSRTGAPIVEESGDGPGDETETGVEADGDDAETEIGEESGEAETGKESGTGSAEEAKAVRILRIRVEKEKEYGQRDPDPKKDFREEIVRCIGEQLGEEEKQEDGLVGRLADAVTPSLRDAEDESEEIGEDGAFREQDARIDYTFREVCGERFRYLFEADEKENVVRTKRTFCASSGKEYRVTGGYFNGTSLWGSRSAPVRIEASAGCLVSKSDGPSSVWSDSISWPEPSVERNHTFFVRDLTKKGAGRISRAAVVLFGVDAGQVHEDLSSADISAVSGPDGSCEDGTPLFAEGLVRLRLSVRDSASGLKRASLEMEGESAGKYRRETVLFPSGEKEVSAGDRCGDWTISGTSGKAAFLAVQDLEIPWGGRTAVRLELEDFSGNTSRKEASFEADGQSPRIEIQYPDGELLEGGYYSGSRTVKVLAEDRNLDSDAIRCQVWGDGRVLEEPDWEKEAEGSYSAEMVFEGDGTYSFLVSASDRAGNRSGEKGPEFTVRSRNPSGNQGEETEPLEDPGNDSDRSDGSGKNRESGGTPGAAATGGEEERGSSGEQEEADTGKKHDSFRLLRIGRTGETENVTDRFVIHRSQTGDADARPEIPDDPENDGIYVLTATKEDDRGKRKTSEQTFVVNRYGSVYEFGTRAAALNGKYIRRVREAIEITERNPGRLEGDFCGIEVTRDGKILKDPVKLRKESLTAAFRQGTVFSAVAGFLSGKSGERVWSICRYLLSPDLFRKEGVYRISLFSTDDSGNRTVSESGESGELSFCVDRTPPAVTAVHAGAEAGKSGSAGRVRVFFEVSDAGGIASLRLIRGGKERYSFRSAKYENRVSGETRLTGKTWPAKFRIAMKDLAGNETEAVFLAEESGEIRSVSGGTGGGDPDRIRSAGSGKEAAIWKADFKAEEDPETNTDVSSAGADEGTEAEWSGALPEKRSDARRSGGKSRDVSGSGARTGAGEKGPVPFLLLIAASAVILVVVLRKRKNRKYAN
ncbi:MAG: hypothetical protein ACOYBC_07025 [Bilifractor sp.]|jgi:hypothetical protein